MELKVPDYWYRLCETMFATGQGLAERLWSHIPQAEKVAWELRRMQDRGTNYRAILNRTRRLAQVLPPKDLLAAAARLEPEGTPRSKEIRRFEEKVLALCDQGNWRKW